MLSLMGGYKQNYNNFQTFSSESGHGPLLEVVTYKRFKIIISDLTFGTLENWTLRRGSQNWSFNCIK